MSGVTAVFAFAKLAELLLRPFNLVFLVAAVGAALLFSHRWRLGRVLVATALATALVPALLPFDQWLVGALEGRFPPHPPLPAHIDGIIVLGGAVDPALSAKRGMPIIRAAADRITAMIVLARRHPEARIIYSGGSGDPLDQTDKEAPEVRRLLADMGRDTSAITFEARSRNTRENALFSRALMEPKPGETWLLVTSAIHMPRAIGSFRAIGWPVIAYPVDFQTAGDGGPHWPRFDVGAGLGGLTAVGHELLGLAMYRLAGWSDTLLPAP